MLKRLFATLPMVVLTVAACGSQSATGPMTDQLHKANSTIVQKYDEDKLSRDADSICGWIVKHGLVRSNLDDLFRYTSTELGYESGDQGAIVAASVLVRCPDSTNRLRHALGVGE